MECGELVNLPGQFRNGRRIRLWRHINNMLKLPFIISFLLLIMVMGLFGIACERLFYRPLKMRTYEPSSQPGGAGYAARKPVTDHLGSVSSGHSRTFRAETPYSWQRASHTRMCSLSVTVILLNQTVLFKRTTMGKVLRAAAQTKRQPLMESSLTLLSPLRCLQLDSGRLRV